LTLYVLVTQGLRPGLTCAAPPALAEGQKGNFSSLYKFREDFRAR
jgi:hypothetical protein